MLSVQATRHWQQEIDLIEGAQARRTGKSDRRNNIRRKLKLDGFVSAETHIPGLSSAIGKKPPFISAVGGVRKAPPKKVLG